MNGEVLAVAGAIGLLLPLVQSIIQKPYWSPRVKAILAVVFAIVGGVAGYVITNGLSEFDINDPIKIATWVAGVYVASTTLYARLLRPVGATDYLEQRVLARRAAPDTEGGPVG
jgi:hypothetical protein